MQDAYVELEKLVTKEESSRVADLELEYAALVKKLEAEREIHGQIEGRKQAMIQQEELIASLQETISEQVSPAPQNPLALLNQMHDLITEFRVNVKNILCHK